jgi:hypothetical protein
MTEPDSCLAIGKAIGAVSSTITGGIEGGIATPTVTIAIAIAATTIAAKSEIWGLRPAGAFSRELAL